MQEINTILTHEQIEKKIHRIAFQIYENFLEEKELIIAGINGNGYYLAEMIAAKVNEIGKSKSTLVLIELDKQNPKSTATTLNIAGEKVKSRPVIIVDDVLNTGKTMVYAISAFIREGSSVIKTAVLADRNHKKFPVAADYVGISLATTLQEHLKFEVEKANMRLILE